MSGNTAAWLTEWFKERNKTKNIDVAANAGNNYFELGLIDSLEIVSLIVEAENKFGIKFNEKNFQDRRFATINGLAEIIDELTK